MNNLYRKGLVIVFLFFPLLTGCWNMREPEHMFYAHAIGIDYQNGQFKLYVQILDFSTLGKQEGGGAKNKTTEGAWIGKGIGGSIQSALHNLYATSQRRIYWGHLNAVVVSESVLELGIDEVLEIATRYNEFRYTLWVFGTRNSVEDILLASPILESSPVYSQLGDPYDVYTQSSFIRPMRLYRLIAEMRGSAKTALLPLINLSRGHWDDKEKTYNALEIEGVGIIKDEKWNGWLSKEKFSGARWMDSQTDRTPLVIDSEKQPVTALVLEHPKPQITWNVQDGKVYFDIKISVKGSIGEMAKDISESIVKNRAEKQISKEIRDSFLEGIKKETDILRVMDSLYRKDLAEWQTMKQPQGFPLDEESLQTIDVNVRITNGGRTVGSFSP